MGRNGMGKTTLMKTLMGLVPVKAGSIQVEGDDVAALKSHARVAKGLAYVPQGRMIFSTMTVQENIETGLTVTGTRKVPQDLYDMFPVLLEMKGRRGGNLSGGQQQQLAIGRALVQRPRLLLLDEMSMGLAPSIVADLFALVASLKTQGIAVVMVEQFVGQALKVADRAIVLEQGSVVAAGAPADLSSDDIAAAYLGGGGDSTVAVRPAPASARERLAVSVPGSEARRLHALAAAQGRPVDDLLGELLAGALADHADGGEDVSRRRRTR
jgi:urea transport system ATP-binding protein